MLVDFPCSQIPIFDRYRCILLSFSLDFYLFSTLLIFRYERKQSSLLLFRGTVWYDKYVAHRLIFIRSNIENMVYLAGVYVTLRNLHTRLTR